MTMSGQTLSSSFSHISSNPALIIPAADASSRSLTISYSRLHVETSALQDKLLQLGIQPQDAVSIAVPNSYEFTVAFLAATRARAIAAPLNPAYKQSEFEFYVSDLSSALLLAPRDAVAQDAPCVRAARQHNAAIAECYLSPTGDVVLEVKERGKLDGRSVTPKHDAQEGDIALVLHTSGTTGRPKAVPLTHLNLTTTMRNITATYDLSEKDRTLLVMPLFHVHGLLAAFLAPLHSGGSIVLQVGGFSASAFFTQFKDHACNWYTAVPTIHQILLKAPPAPATAKALNIRFIRSCSSPLPRRVLAELERVFGAPVLEAYAMTEAAHQMTSNPLPRRGPHRAGSVGIAHGTAVSILDLAADRTLPAGAEGEIAVMGANVTPGYLNDAGANARAFTPSGWFRTGDQGKLDERGYVTITGRIKELINKGGEKISPVEIDEAVVRVEGVAEAVAFALEDEKYGQDIGVAVVLKDGAKAGEREVKEYMSENMAKFKVPKRVWVTKVMPKTATGKVQRRLVAEEMLKQETPRAKL